MNRYFRSCFALSILLPMSSPGFAGSPSPKTTEPTPNVTVWLYDYARIHREALAQAKFKAGSIFRRAGVNVAWVDCPRSAEEVSMYPDCRGLPGPAALVLRIYPRPATDGHARACGLAVLPPDGGFGLQGEVYASCAEERPVLGHLIAHELGHLLIGTMAHSSGVMKADWSHRELEYAVQGRLLFSGKDARRIRDNVSERMRAEEAAGIARLRASR